MLLASKLTSGRSSVLKAGPAPRLPIACCQLRPVRKVQVVCAAASVDEAPASLPTSLDFGDEGDASQYKAFPALLPLDPGQQSLSNIPLALFYPLMLVGVGAAGFVGSLLGKAMPVEPQQKDAVSVGVAAITAAGAAYGAVEAKKKRDSAAVIELYNGLVDLDDPSELTQEMVDSVGSRFGIKMNKDQIDGLKRVYGQYLEHMIPSGDKQLKGDEYIQIRAFKDALGLSDEDAAPVHIEVGRKFAREGSETKDRNAQFERRKALQRLIYVSQLVFGDQKAAFLLPWRRTFNLTDAQVFVARRDNAKAIFKSYMEAQGGKLPADREFLTELKARAVDMQLMDETAADAVKEYARRSVEQHVARALEAIKPTGSNKDVVRAVDEVAALLKYNRQLVSLSKDADLIAGLGQVTLHGGPYAPDSVKGREVKELFKLFVDEKLNMTGEFGPELEQEASELQHIFGLGPKEAQVMQDEVSANLYRKLLKEEVTSGRLDAAASPATVLGDLCERVNFSPEAALELHKGLYKQKVQEILAKKVIDDDADAALKRIRRILCVPVDVAKKVMRETAGKVLEEVISDIYLMGAKPLSTYEAERVDKVIKDLRLDADVAMEVLTLATRERFRNYIAAAQKERDRKDFATSIKKLMQFNALVVTPLVEKVKGVDAAKKEMADLLMKAMEAAKAEEKEEGIKEGSEASSLPPPPPKEDSVTQVKKAIQTNRGEFAEEERKAQKEITLKDDLDAGKKGEIYKTYLMYSMSGDVVELPVGGVIRKKTSNQTRQAEMTRLNSLADLLGMTQQEVMAVQGDMAEQAYKQQATEIMRTGPLNEEKAQYLEEMRAQLGMSKETSDKIIKTARTELYGSAAAAEDGKWTLERVLEMHRAGSNVDSLLEDVTRRNLYRKELSTKISDGTGDLNADYMLHELPNALSLPASKLKQIIKEEVATRKRMLLVQAVSQYRQKRTKDTIISLNNLISCLRILPEAEPMAWKERQELKDVFGIFCSKEYDDNKRATLQKVLGISDSEAAELQTTASMDEARKKGEEAELSFF